MISEVEMAFIGILLNKPDLLTDVSGMVSPKDFQDGRAARAYSMILDMWTNGQHVSLVSMSVKAQDMAPWLAEAYGDVIPLSSAAIQYAGDIAKDAKARRIENDLKAIQQKHRQSPESTLDDIVALYRRETTVTRKDSRVSIIADRFKSTIERNRLNGNMGTPTGLDFLENMHIQYMPGHIWTMGGFTSVGKTAAMIEKLCRLLTNCPDARVVVISTEMTQTQIMARIVANMTGYHSNLILSGKLDGEAGLRVEKCIERIGEFNLTIYDDVYLLAEIESACRRAEMQGGVDVVFIDYVQNCQVPEARSEYQEQATLAKRLQKMAKDVGANVVCLSQVSNSVGRGDTDLLELKGAGEWSAVSDVSIMLRRNKADDTQLLFCVKKNRHGMKHGQGEGCILKFGNNFTRLNEHGLYLQDAV